MGINTVVITPALQLHNLSNNDYLKQMSLLLGGLNWTKRSAAPWFMLFWKRLLPGWYFSGRGCYLFCIVKGMVVTCWNFLGSGFHLIDVLQELVRYCLESSCCLIDIVRELVRYCLGSGCHLIDDVQVLVRFGIEEAAVSWLILFGNYLDIV